MSGGVWMASYVALWAAVVVLLVMVLALVRQIGLLHGRLDEGSVGAGAGSSSAAAGAAGGSGAAGGGSYEPTGPEGPPLGAPAPMPGRIGYQRAPLTLVAFTSESCELSAVLAPALRVVDKQYADVRVVDLPLGPRTIAAFEAFNVSHTPFVVAVGQDGRVRARGRARNLQQLEAFVTRALAVATRATTPPVIVLDDLAKPPDAVAPTPSPPTPPPDAATDPKPAAPALAADAKSEGTEPTADPKADAPTPAAAGAKPTGPTKPGTAAEPTAKANSATAEETTSDAAEAERAAV